MRITHEAHHHRASGPIANVGDFYIPTSIINIDKVLIYQDGFLGRKDLLLLYSDFPCLIQVPNCLIFILFVTLHLTLFGILLVVLGCVSS